MITLRFECVDVSPTPNCEGYDLQFNVVDGKENKEFFTVPLGKLELNTVDADTAIQFKVGGKYFIDISSVE